MAFRILSLDGGGIRGAFAAACLARLELELQRPITEFFDLIAGTSTGGIIALALALGESAATIRDLYRNKGVEIFATRDSIPIPKWQRLCLSLARRKFPQLDENALYRSKYRQEAIKAALTEVYADRTMGDVTASRLVIPAVDLIHGRTIVFKTPHRPNFVRDRRFKAVDVALATAAAPTYFPHASMGEGTKFSDGGLWANNPALVAYVEATKISEECTRPGVDPVFGPGDIAMVSIGTGRPRYYANPGPTDDGLIWWGQRLFDVSGGAQSQGAHEQARYLMGGRYLRIDFDMPTQPWSLDDVRVLPQLLHYGDQAAVDHYASLRENFLAVGKTPYRGFDP